MPWEMVSAGAEPYPGVPGLEIARPHARPFWEDQPDTAQHGHSNRAERRAAAIQRGARSRRGSAETRRTVLRRDRFRCVCPDCPNHVWIELHHVTMYCRGGASMPFNQITLCGRCHRNEQLSRLVITGDLERGLDWRDRHGAPLGHADEATRRRSGGAANLPGSCCPQSFPLRDMPCRCPARDTG